MVGLICLVLALLTLAVFRSVIHHEFIKFDDSQYVTDNPHVVTGLTLKNIKWAFRSGYASNWHPLTWLSHMLDVQLFGLSAGAHHRTSLVLHIANALLLFLLLRRLTGALWRSAMVGTLFALHPLHVESVAWVAERKDVLSALFFLLTLWAYSKYVEEKAKSAPFSAPASEPSSPELNEPTAIQGACSFSQTRLSNMDPESAGSISACAGESREEEAFVGGPGSSEVPFRGTSPLRRGFFYTLALLLFALGLMSKPMLVTLPFVLLLLDWWPLARIQTTGFQPTTLLSLALEKVPFLILTAASCAVTYLAQAKSHSVIAGLPLSLRFANAVVSCVKYLGKTFWPAHLAIFYPHPNTRYRLPVTVGGFPASDQWPLALIILATLLLVGISGLALYRARRGPWLITGWFWYLGTLVPVIGLVQIGMQGMADRYTYIPQIGLFISAVWTAAELLQQRKYGLPVLASAGLLIVACCAALSQRQVGYWQNNFAVFDHALRVTRHNAIAHCNVGEELGRQGRVDLAQDHFRAALRDDPRCALAYFDLGLSLELQGKPAEALEPYLATVRLRPWVESSRLRLAGLLKLLGRQEEALAEYAEVLHINPAQASAHYHMGTILAAQSNISDALAHFAEALRLKPDYSEALIDLGMILAAQGKFTDAQQSFRRALALSPTNAKLHLELAKTLMLGGNASEAAPEFAEALRLAPELPDELLREARLLSGQGQLNAAFVRFNTVLWLKPNSCEALSGLAWILATHPSAQFRNGPRALLLAQRALQFGGDKDAVCWAALDAAFAANGRFDEAVSAAEKARELAVAAGDNAAVQACETRLALYRNQQPYHQ
jgi:tetratricopeptide (TPR) repeat protein